MERLTQVQDSFIDDMRALEEYFRNEISRMEAEKEGLVAKIEIQTVERIEIVRTELTVEIDRLKVLLGIYKDKFTRKEETNRNLLVELKLYQSWKEQYTELQRKYHAKCNEFDSFVVKTKEQIEQYEKEITRLKEEIEKKRRTITSLTTEKETLMSEIERMKITIKSLEEEIERLRKEIAELRARGVETKIVEKIVYVEVDKKPEKKSEHDVEYDEEYS